MRYNLPYRRRRPKGPPSGHATKDQAGVVEAIELAHTLADGPVIAGGHSYGGRMTSMVAADKTADIDVLTLFSYPLHPPGKPERARTEHLPLIAVPTVFIHGTSDPFGTIDEMRPAAALIAAPTEIVEITGARHDLRLQVVRCSGVGGRRGTTLAGVTAWERARDCSLGDRRADCARRGCSYLYFTYCLGANPRSM